MKKLYAIISILLFSIFNIAETNAGSCDQVFNGSLRYGQGYSFGDTFTNNGSKEIKISNKNISFLAQYDYNGSASNPSFPWNSNFKNVKQYSVFPGQTENIIDSTPSYALSYYPPVRGSNNLVIKYEIQYYTKNGATYVGPTTHTECKNYTITRCGDAVKDNAYEQCDDGNNVNGDGCSSTCNIEPTPVCTGLTATPSSGISPLNSTVTCSGTNVSSYRIDCGNGTSVNAATGSCNYPVAGTYSASCYVNGQTATPAVCKKTVTVTPPPVPVCTGLTTSPSSGISPLNSTVTCTGNDVSSFRIDCGNGTSVNAATGNCNYPVAGTYAASCYINGQTTTPAACKKTVTVTPPVVTPVCNTLTATPNIGESTLNSTVTCLGTNVSSYRIDCGNGTSVNAATGNCNYSSVGSYTASCYVDGQITTPVSCQKTVTVTPPVSTAVCNTLTATPNSGNAPLNSNVSCSGTDVTSYRIDCGNGTSVNAASGNCNYSSAGSYTASCYVDGQVTTPLTCRKSISVNPPLTFCGDGTIQTPNDAGFTEQCDDGNNNNGDGCSATCTIEPFVPSISIDKIDANPIDFDTIIGNDTQSIGSGATSTFKITLTNNGTDDLTNLVITDIMGANCAGSVPLPAFPVTFMSGSLSGSGNHLDNIFQIGEILEYFCDSNTQAPYTNTISVNALGILSGNPVTDSDISQVLLQVPTPVIQIVKTDNNPGDLDLMIGTNDSQTVNSGSVAIFNITVTNIGTEDLNTVAITDPLVAACGRTVAETIPLIQAIGNLDTVFNIGEIFTYNCTDPIYTGTYPLNTAGVSAIGVTSLIPVTDTDTSAVILSTIPVVPVCTNLTVSQNSGSSPYSANYSCTGSGITSYNVVLTDPSGNPTSTTTATGVFNIIQQGTYQASCFINGITTTTPACSKTLNYSTGCTNCGGGSTPRCNQAVFNGGSVTCSGYSITSFEFTCDNKISSINPNPVILSRAGGSVTFDLSECNSGVNTASGGINATTMNFTGAECRAFRFGSPVTSRKACQYDPGNRGGPVCGDGAVQTYFPHREECDDGNNTNGDGCNSACKLDTITNPYGGAIEITAFDDIVMIGDGMDPYDIHNLSAPVLKNTGNIDNDLVLDRFCAYSDPANSSLDGPINPTCQNIPGGILYPGESVALVGLNGKYEGNISGIPGTNKTDDNDIIYTVVEADGNHSLAAYYNKDLTVRVVKPTITTTGGGTSYIKNTNLSNLKTIGTGVSGVSNNTNYVGAGIGNNLSSSSKDSIDTTQSEAEGNKLETQVEEKLESITTSNWIKYNGMDNVYYIKGTVDITTGFNVNKNPIDNSVDTASKTYIIDGDLIISQDITGYPGSLAFIVKGGNIRIRENVKNLQGTYIALPDSSGNKGKINGEGSSTNNVLQVKGSMYGDNTNLLSKRTYIKNNSSGQIDVGTIVSFGSSVFRKPAPLTTKFINDYLETTKVAQ